MTTMTADLAYTSDTALETAWARRGWDAVDRMVLWAVERRRGEGTFDSISVILPDGLSYRVLETTLDGLVADGLIESRRVFADPSGPVTAIGSVQTVYAIAEHTSDLTNANTRKAA